MADRTSSASTGRIKRCVFAAKSSQTYIHRTIIILRTFAIHRFNMHPIGTTFTPLDCSLPSVWICGRTASSPSILKTVPRLPILSILYFLTIVALLLIFF